MWTSEPQIPQARTLISTSSAPICGSGSSRSSNRGSCQTCDPLRAIRVASSCAVGRYSSRGAHSPPTCMARIGASIRSPRMTLREQLEDVCAVTVTPFDDGGIDLDGVARNARHLTDGGVRVVVCGGNTGEFY